MAHQEEWRCDGDDMDIKMLKAAVRCEECRNVILRSEVYDCQLCSPAKHRKDRHILCDLCGPRIHRHRNLNTAPEMSTVGNTGEAAEENKDDEGADGKKDEEKMDEAKAVVFLGDSIGQDTVSVSGAIGYPSMKDQLRRIVDLVHGGVLANFEREIADMEERRFALEKSKYDLEKRRVDMENKQNQLYNIVRRFEEDVKALFANESECVFGHDAKADEWKRTERAFPIRERKSLIDIVNVPNERQIFVGGLPSSVTEDELCRVFSEYGQVVGCKLLPRLPGKNACAFLAFDKEETAQQILNSPVPVAQFPPEIRSRRLYVEAKCSTAMDELPDVTKVRVVNLPFRTRLVDIKRFFDNYGKVVGAKVRRRPPVHQSRSPPRQSLCAYVAFETPEMAERVAEQGRFRFGAMERPIYVKLMTRRGEVDDN